VAPSGRIASRQSLAGRGDAAIGDGGLHVAVGFGASCDAAPFGRLHLSFLSRVLAGFRRPDLLELALDYHPVATRTGCRISKKAKATCLRAFS
jgi:hypothetical protein